MNSQEHTIEFWLSPKLGWALGWVVIICLGVVVVGILGILSAIRPKRIVTLASPSDFGWVAEDVSLTTNDRVEIAGWLVKSQIESDRVIIILHGYPADKANMLAWAQFLQRDYNLMFVDFRYFGESRGSWSFLGLKETAEVEAAVEWLTKRGYDKIGIYGFSMGGFTAMKYANDNPKIKAVVSDSAYTDLGLMIKHLYRRLSIFRQIAYWTDMALVKLVMGYSRVDLEAISRKSEYRVPTLLVHSKADSTVPIEHGLRYANNDELKGMVESFFYNDGQHGLVPAQVLPTYQKRVGDFFESYLY